MKELETLFTIIFFLVNLDYFQIVQVNIKILIYKIGTELPELKGDYACLARS